MRCVTLNSTKVVTVWWRIFWLVSRKIKESGRKGEWAKASKRTEDSKHETITR